MQALPGYTDVVYGRYARGSGDRVWLQYWLFYLFNDKSLAGIGLHEGDWEMVQVAIDGGRPSGATFAQHSGAEKRDDWADVRTAEGTGGASPLVYVGLGSHASYFDPGEYRISLFPMLDHARGNGRRVRPRVVELTGDAGWLEWPGRWGRMGPSDTSSPRGPQQHEKQWKRPDAFHADARGRRRKLGPIYVAVPGAAPSPADHRAARWRRVLISYDVRAAEVAEARAAAAVGRVRRPPEAPSTHSFLVAKERATVRHPGAHRRGRLRRARDGTDRGGRRSDTVTVDVAPAGATGRPLPREGFALRLLVELADDWSGGLPALRKAVRAALGTDADGRRWEVGYLFPTTRGRARPARLRRHVSVTGRAIVAPAYPPQQQAFDLAHRLRDATGADVQPDLPSSVFAAPETSDAVPGRIGAQARRSAAPMPKDWSLQKIRCRRRRGSSSPVSAPGSPSVTRTRGSRRTRSSSPRRSTWRARGTCRRRRRRQRPAPKRRMVATGLAAATGLRRAASSPAARRARSRVRRRASRSCRCGRSTASSRSSTATSPSRSTGHDAPVATSSR